MKRPFYKSLLFWAFISLIAAYLFQGFYGSYRINKLEALQNEKPQEVLKVSDSKDGGHVLEHKGHGYRLTLAPGLNLSNVQPYSGDYAIGNQDGSCTASTLDVPAKTAEKYAEKDLEGWIGKDGLSIPQIQDLGKGASRTTALKSHSLTPLQNKFFKAWLYTKEFEETAEGLWGPGIKQSEPFKSAERMLIVEGRGGLFGFQEFAMAGTECGLLEEVGKMLERI